MITLGATPGGGRVQLPLAGGTQLLVAWVGGEVQPDSVLAKRFVKSRESRRSVYAEAE